MNDQTQQPNPPSLKIHTQGKSLLIQRDISNELSKSSVWVERRNFYGSKRSPDVYFVIGFDTEFKPPKGITLDDIKDGKAKNEILSYQVWCRIESPDLRSSPEWGGVVYPEPGKRISFADILTYAIWKGVSGGHIEDVPTNVLMVGHFTRADLPNLCDFPAMTFRVDAVRNTFVTLDQRIEVDFDLPGGEPINVSVTLRDTMLLTAAGAKSLRAIGDLVGVPKVVLDPDPLKEQHLKENMDELLATDPALFEEYALTDAVICVRYIERIIERCKELLGTAKVPTTLSGIGVNLLIGEWEAAGLDRLTLLGKEEIKEKVWNNRRGRYETRFKEIDIAEVDLYRKFAIEGYHGGRNEQYHFGPGFEGVWTDYDLSGAYPTAMALLRKADWKNLRTTTNPQDFTALTLGVAQVEFEFKASVRFPTIPVRTENGLIFPRKGTSFCGAPEIALALALGAKLKIKHGVVVPYADDTRIFGNFIKGCTAKRKSFPKRTIDELFWKELSNSCYGKTAQGLREKRAYSMKSRDTKLLPASQITQPFFAAYITSFVRAVLGEIMNTLPPSASIFSCTTDGFLTTATTGEMAVATSGPLCKLFGGSREWLTGKYEVVEVKHVCRRPLGWRTRGQATLTPGDTAKPDENIVLAKGGIHAPGYADSTEEQNKFIVDLFFNREPDQVLEIHSLTGVRDIVEHDADLVDKTLIRRLGMEFDWKRQPLAVSEAAFDNHQHVAFSTKPWQTVEEFQTVRSIWDDLQSDGRFCLKTLEDYERFATQVLVRTALGDDTAYLKKKAPDVSRLRQMLCSAWHHSAAGLDKTALGLSAREFAELLTAAGIPCKRTDVENGKNKPFEPHCCPPTLAVKAAVKKLKRSLKGLDDKTLLAVGDGQIDMLAAMRPHPT